MIPVVETPSGRAAAASFSVGMTPELCGSRRADSGPLSSSIRSLTDNF
jgi:hypothetical protein